MTEPLQLGELIAEGNGSLVFDHPSDPNRIVKIMKPERDASRVDRLTRPQKRKFGPFREWAVEYDHYLMLIARTGRCPDYHARFYGFEDTSMGVGHVVEKISNEGASDLSQTLQAFLDTGGDKSIARDLIDQFFQAIARDQAVFRDINLSNLCIVQDANGTPSRLVAVDGLGEFTMIPLRTMARWAYQKWHARRWKEILAQIGAK